MIGVDGDQANHQYDTEDFFAAVKAGNMPAVSFLKAPGLSGCSRRLLRPARRADVRRYRSSTSCSRHPEWKSTAVIINYDDSDGWYDHQMGPIVNQSQTVRRRPDRPRPVRQLRQHRSRRRTSGTTSRDAAATVRAFPCSSSRPRRSSNFVDHTVTDQTSIIRFIEDNWLGGQRITGSFDSLAGTLNGMFDFNEGARKLRQVPARPLHRTRYLRLYSRDPITWGR